MGARIRAHHWGRTALGPLDGWPASLCTALSMVLDSRFPCFLCWGPDFISFHNDACQPLLGEQVALGRPFRDVWAEAWDTVGPLAERAWQGEASYVEDLPIVLERSGYPGQAWHTFSYSPVRDEAGTVAGILCTVVETTGKVKAIAELREKEDALRHLNERLAHQQQQAQALRVAEDALRQSQKMDAVGQLTGGLAHDFNNMLAGVSGHLELMKLRLKMGQIGDLPGRIDSALGVTHRAAALTHRLLAFSRRQALDPKPTDANALAATTTELVTHTAGPSIRLETCLASGLWLSFCDPNQLESALLNLANNARDAMPDGGLLRIETANVTLDLADAARHPGLQPGEHVAISVSDTGSGMTPDVLARAFDPFFTTKPLGQGTGLGLSMVYGFATQSHGHVRIESEPGRGTVVCLTLPRHHALQAAMANGGACEGAPDPDGGKGVVMIVDDEDNIRAVMAEVLQLHGYAVLEAADAHGALRLLQTGPEPDVLITDIGLPGGMNGRQLADIARAQLPRLPILLITGYAESTVMKNESLPAQMELLTKPFAMNALLARLAAMAGQAA
jgi:signal transduction histidine kinase/ActR/RegA family two-component response regulator